MSWFSQDIPTAEITIGKTTDGRVVMRWPTGQLTFNLDTAKWFRDELFSIVAQLELKQNQDR